MNQQKPGITEQFNRTVYVVTCPHIRAYTFKLLSSFGLSLKEAPELQPLKSKGMAVILLYLFTPGKWGNRPSHGREEPLPPSFAP